MGQPRILVSGASGFIGRALIPQLVDAGYVVRAAARDPSGLEGPRVEPVNLPDLRSEKVNWQDLVAGCEYVLHLAGIAHARDSIPEADYQTVNCGAVRDLAGAARIAGVKRVIFLSSIRAQTGPVAKGVLDERFSAHPHDAYGRAKLEGERMLADVLRDTSTDWVTLRPVLVYGSGVKGNMAALLKLAQLPAPLPLASLQAQRSILSIANLNSAVLHCLRNEQVSRRVFIVADLAPVRVGEIVSSMRKGLKRNLGTFPVPLNVIGLLAKIGGQGARWERLNGDLIVSTDALQETGWRPVIGTSKALADMARDSAKDESSKRRS